MGNSKKSFSQQKGSVASCLSISNTIDLHITPYKKTTVNRG